MLHIIRTTPKRIKYCGRTVDALIAANRNHRTDIAIISDPQPRSLNNAINQLAAGIKTGDDIFCLLEDDIEFINNFDESVRLWVRDCEGSGSLCYPLAAAYKEVGEVKGIAWKWPIQGFYGTQAVVFTRDNAISLHDYLKNPDHTGHEFDLQIKDWVKKNGGTHQLTPSPSFVQHVGVESSLHKNRFHWYGSFGGHDWTYVNRSSVFSPKERATHKFDETLARALAAFFRGNSGVVSDCGCGSGRYVEFLRSQKIPTVGYDGSPGCGGNNIIEADLSRDQKFGAATGGVLCLEVAEHIHPENEAIFLKNIIALCSGKLVLSWAVKGQGGVRHVNEQDDTYVIPRMEGFGFKLDHLETTKLREAATISWFKKSIYVFTR